jgi:hypothetical protein
MQHASTVLRVTCAGAQGSPGGHDWPEPPHGGGLPRPRLSMVTHFCSGIAAGVPPPQCHLRSTSGSPRDVRGTPGSLAGALGSTTEQHCRARGLAGDARPARRGTTSWCLMGSEGPLQGRQRAQQLAIGVPTAAPQALAGDSSGRSEISTQVGADGFQPLSNGKFLFRSSACGILAP